MIERGKFIVAEGGVGAGKSTLIELLKPQLEGWEFYREPGGTPFGDRVRDAVQGDFTYEVNPYAALFGYVASRANLIRGVIIPKLEQGTNILLDRYWYSSFAYQGAEGVSKPIIWAINYVATKGLKPNMVLHYELLPEIGKRRKQNSSDADRYDLKGIEFHRKVRENYFLLSRLYPGIWRIIDASQPVPKVFSDSMNALRERGIV